MVPIHVSVPMPPLNAPLDMSVSGCTLIASGAAGDREVLRHVVDRLEIDALRSVGEGEAKLTSPRDDQSTVVASGLPTFEGHVERSIRNAQS